MIVFIVVPNNKSLGSYVETTLEYLGNPSKDKLVVSRGEDVPFIVESLSKNGKEVLGLTGRDLFKEYEISNYNTKLRVVKTINWEDGKALFGKPALCLLGPKNKKLGELQKKLKVCINSKYRNLAKKFLNILEDKGYRFAKIYLSGSTESAFSNGISDLVIDIVYTGGSIKKAGLEVYDKIMESDFVIIGNEGSERVANGVCKND